MGKSVWVGDRRTSLPDQSDGLYDKMTGYMDKERAADAIHPDFREHGIFTWKLKKYGLEEWTIR